MKDQIKITMVVLVAGAALGWWFLGTNSADTAAQVDDVAFPVAAVDVFVRVAQKQKPDVSRKQVLDGLIENHLFAQSAPTDDHQHDDGGSGLVTYSEETRQQNELFRIVRQVFSGEVEQVLATENVNSPADLFVTDLVTDEETLGPLLEVKPGPYPVMDADQEQAAHLLVLARYRLLDGREKDMTLADLYRQQNIQLKVQMHQMNTDFIREAAQQYVSTQFVLNWFEHHSGLTEDEVLAVKRMIHERQIKEEMLHELGLMHDIHDDNPQLRALAEAVTVEEVSAYYNAHKEQFQRVEKVRARHIRLDSQEEADALFREIRNGLTFDQALQQFQGAAGAKPEQAGDLGWINRDDRNTHWLRGLAFVQPLQKASAPFRSPGLSGQVYWEIIFLDEKVMGYQPIDSEGVRYEASKSIAQEKMQQQFASLRDSLWREANVRYNEEWLAQSHDG
jgi:hypothetical protein